MSVSPEHVEPLLRGSFGRPYLYEPTCRSTQDLVRGSGLPHGAVAATDHQSGGRGRLGRTWEDTPGRALLCSVLLHPPVDSRAAELSLLAGLAVAESIEDASGHPAQVKWPNDVLLDGCKVAGILLETDGAAVVCGIGVNVNQTAAELPGRPTVQAGSLRTVTGRTYDRAPLLASLLEAFERHFAAWVHEGLRGVHPGLSARDALRGRRVRIGRGVGVADGIAPDGQLQVVVDGEPVLVRSGEVEILD